PTLPQSIRGLLSVVFSHPASKHPWSFIRGLFPPCLKASVVFFQRVLREMSVVGRFPMLGKKRSCFSDNRKRPEETAEAPQARFQRPALLNNPRHKSCSS
ncbi:MAG: hypothetical protein JJU05_13825, partial [Verrucomicrobia bacterium]|nr:hypothetical protein [Verrucomicrobiota bacterium]